MSERIHALAQLVLGKSSLEECSVEEIQHLIKRYPYFAPLQFLWLQKLKATGSPDYEAQQQKAVLYFHDPLQFEYVNSPERFFVDENALLKVDRNHAVQQESTDAMIDNDLSSVEEETLLLSEQIEGEDNGFLATKEEVAAGQESSLVDEKSAFVDKEQTDLRESNPVAEEDPESSNESSTAPVEIEREEIQPAPKSIDELEDQEGLPTNAALPEHVRETETDSTTDENRFAADAHNDNTSAGSEGAEPEAAFPQADSSVQHDPETDPESEPLFKRSALHASIASNTTAPLAFEPFHTVDYFASQGIKISSEELPRDKLTTQVRSFTDWLKVMKRLPASDMAKVPESPAEKTVETMASHSVEGSDVVTEAMAEVWTKQGNRRKAIETYNKLSLLNPSKKAYFAAKIENLKGS